MACDCAGQSYSYDSTARGQPAYPTGLSVPLSPSRSCRARNFWFSCPLILSSYLILPSTFPPRLHSSWSLSPKDQSAGGFPALNLSSENRLSAFSDAVVS